MINILAAGNNKYSFATEIFIISLLENSGQHGVDIYFLYNELSELNREKLKKRVEQYKGCSIKFLYVDLELFAGSPLEAVTNPYITIETYFRLAMGLLLPDKVEKILYLDTDVIVNKDIMTFYESNFDKNTAAIVCEDYGLRMSHKLRKKVYSNLKFKEEEKYFNAGVILFNAKFLKNNFPFEKFTTFIKNNHSKLMFHDQDVLNYMLKEHLKYQDYNLYNCRPFFYMFSKRAERKIYDKAMIIHYGEKPWDSTFTDLAGEIFWHYAKISGYNKEYEKWKTENDKYKNKNRIPIILKRIKRNVKLTITKR